MFGKGKNRSSAVWQGSPLKEKKFYVIIEQLKYMKI